MLAGAARHCAGARIVTSAPDLAVVIEAKSAARQPRRLGVPLIAIVPPGEKRKALAAGVDAAYARPARRKAYSPLVAKLLVQWPPTRPGSPPLRCPTPFSPTP